MWGLNSNVAAGRIRKRSGCLKQVSEYPDCSDDDVSSCGSRDEALECQICWESFNMVENVPYVLWCGHTLCKNCVLGLQWAVVRFMTVPIQLRYFTTCPWCHLLSFRLVYKGDLKFPRKNYFLLWMVESLNGDREGPHSSSHRDHLQLLPSNNGLMSSIGSSRPSHHDPTERSLGNSGRASSSNNLTTERIHLSLQKSLVYFVHLTSKFPLVLISLFIVGYAIPASAVVLALYILITILFALPSFLILYFAHPILDWLVREIFN